MKPASLLISTVTNLPQRLKIIYFFPSHDDPFCTFVHGRANATKNYEAFGLRDPTRVVTGVRSTTYYKWTQMEDRDMV